MADSYKTVYMGGEEEIVEKKSRFIAVLEHVESEDEALAFIEAVKKRHWSARHNCFAYSIGNGANPLLRCSDDGEPQGTAGRPMLEVLCGAELCNTVVVVTRYFGGTLLGTGGLVRAYSQATKAGIEGMIGGQSIDLDSEDKTIDTDLLYELQDKKTGALLSAACMIPCFLKEASAEVASQVMEYAMHIGLL